MKIWKSKTNKNVYCYFDDLNALTGNTFPSNDELMESLDWRKVPFGVGGDPVDHPNKVLCQGDAIAYVYTNFLHAREEIRQSLKALGVQLVKPIDATWGEYFFVDLEPEVKAEAPKEIADLLATIERQQKAIEAYEEQLDKAAEILDVYLIQRYGENEAAWEYHVGNEVAPDYVVAEVEQDKDLWALREQINSILDWEQRRLEGDSDICD